MRSAFPLHNHASLELDESMTSPRRRRLRPWPAPPLSSSIYPSFSLARTPSSSSSFLGPIWTGNRAVATKLLVRSPEPCRGSISEEVSPYTCLSPVSVSRTIVLTRFNVYTSHQKVVLEVDFSGKLWVRRHPHLSPPPLTAVLNRATPRLQ